MKNHTRATDPALPSWLVPALLAGMVLLWVGLLALTHQAPDRDSMEELVWASSFEWGYSKHPALPTWLLYPLTWIFGKPIWLPFLAAHSLCALALYLIWRMGCAWVSPARALIAVLALSTSTYFSLRGSIYNHNTVQLWSVAAATFLYYRALKYGRWRTWAGLGLVTGLAFLTKYSVVVQLAAFGLFALVQGDWRRVAFWQGVALAAGVMLVVVSPHLWWLVEHDFAPLRYYEVRAVDQTGSVVGDAVKFLLNQIARNSPMLLVWLALAGWNRRSRDADRAPCYASAMDAWDRSFLLWVGFAPLGLTVAVAIVTGTHLTASSWATTFFILYGFFIFWWLSGDVARNLKRCLVLVITVHVVLALGYALARGPLAQATGHMARSTFAGARLAAQLHARWQTHVPDIPLRLIAADIWLGGNIAVHISPKTEVLIQGDYRQSPWLDAVHALDCGALVAWSPEIEPPSQALAQLRAQAPWQGELRTHWSSERSPWLTIAWGILPPTPQCRGEN